MPKCGHETKFGRPCHQNVDFLPCQYHDRVEFARAVKAITTGQVVPCLLCEDCEQYFPMAFMHTCTAPVRVGS